MDPAGFLILPALDGAMHPALAGGAVGGAIALGFWGLGWTGLDRRHPGAVGSGGLALMAAVCLWTGGWILAAMPCFALLYAGLLGFGGGGGGDRRLAGLSGALRPGSRGREDGRRAVGRSDPQGAPVLIRVEARLR